MSRPERVKPSKSGNYLSQAEWEALKAAGAEDTYAAYCFYGDPLACAAP